MLKKDNLTLGMILGFLTPVLAFVLYWIYARVQKGYSFSQLLDLISINHFMLLPKVMSLCLIANGLVFYLYTRKRRDITAKGIFLVTMLYAIIILLLKIFR
ncbi:hypothetical protein COR50_01430 [Chitinophaga caeni]|uniref:Stationary phase survival protein SurE n=1 Tax=Chitinophaga caeni TaxID=2029983 RepID=A0A291QPK2_9BACT|nr:hypothetical protein [Chitinophaga caeni]ATL45928.1 hypothetical protein COR50_01430 [Chitinophaga caeni]